MIIISRLSKKSEAVQLCLPEGLDVEAQQPNGARRRLASLAWLRLDPKYLHSRSRWLATDAHRSDN